MDLVVAIDHALYTHCSAVADAIVDMQVVGLVGVGEAVVGEEEVVVNIYHAAGDAAANSACFAREVLVASAGEVELERKVLTQRTIRGCFA